MKKFLLASLSFVVVQFASGQITFSFHDGAATLTSGVDLDLGGSSGTSTVGGVTLTAAAFLDGASSPSTFFNGTSTDFGINAAGGGDDTDRFDNGEGIESMVFSFSKGGTFNTIDLSVLGGTAEAVLSFDGGNSFDLFEGSATETTGGGTDIHTITETFLAGQEITLKVSGLAAPGTNFGLQAFTITTSAIPEPSTYALLLGGLVIGVVVLRRRKSVSK
jgi:hypothetical protein